MDDASTGLGCGELASRPEVLVIAALAAISELLPFIKYCKCNGVAHFVIGVSSAFATALIAQLNRTPPAPIEIDASIRHAEPATDKPAALIT